MEIKLYDTIYNVEAYKANYRVDESLAIALYTEEGEPFDYLTTWINWPGADETHAFVKMNNDSYDIEKFIKKYKLGKPTGVIGYSGFNTYALYEFNTNIIPDFPA